MNIRKGSTIGYLKQVYEKEQEDIIVEDYLKANGFTIAGVSRSLDYLITGTKPGTSKVSKARDCGVEIIPEIMFYEKFNLK